MKQKQLIRQRFRDAVFKRDGHTCAFCDCTEDLDAHHITDRTEMPNGGYVMTNGITLCPAHHMDAEQYHITNGESWATDMHPSDLYTKIGSSYEHATTQSGRL